MNSRRIILYVFGWLILLVCGQAPEIYAQSTGFNNPAPDPSSIIDAAATDRGVLIPRMTTAQRKAIASPANGLLVYDITLQIFYYNSGTGASPIWVPINSQWATTNTRIKIIPRDFMATAKSQKGGAQPKGEGYDDVSGTFSNYGVVMADDASDLAAFVTIPAGYKATDAVMYGNDTGVTYDVYEADLTTGNLGPSLGNANVGTTIDITDVDSSPLNFLVIIIHFDDKKTDKAYGGYVTIAPI